ncbi:MAG: hypothetical protein QM775_17975 [Pirellulales bacterium]
MPSEDELLARYDVAAIREQFPALKQKHGDREAVFFDGPAGSQVPERVIQAMGAYLRRMNANHGGVFRCCSDLIVFPY